MIDIEKLETLSPPGGNLKFEEPTSGRGKIEVEEIHSNSNNENFSKCNLFWSGKESLFVYSSSSSFGQPYVCHVCGVPTG